MNEKISLDHEEEPEELKEIGQEKLIRLPEKLAHQIIEKNPNIFEGIEANRQAEVISAVLSELSFSVERTTEYQHSGPLPPAETLAQYAEIIPNGAERIMKMAENQSEHRIKIEKNVIGSETFQSLLGQIFAFILAAGFAYVGWDLVKTGHDTAGITVFGFDIVGLATVFILGRKKKNKSLEESQE